MDNQLYLILIVDDNPSNIALLLFILEESNFRVLVATNGEDALRKVEEVTPDLILLDVMMPTIDGFEVCRRLKENLTTKKIPVIFMTALAEIENKVKGFALGAVDYITKPLQQDEVLSRVRLHLKLHELNRSLEEKNKYLTEEIAARLRVEMELKQLNQHLDRRVQERTQELSQALKELQLREERLKYQATHDSLTGLFNRAWLIDTLSRKIENYQFQQNDYSILFIDLDQFQKINDRLGYLAGDEVLKSLANRLQNYLSSIGKIARLGGDEFLAIIPGQWQVPESESIIQNIFEQLKTPFSLKNYQIFVRVSIGIVPSINGYQNSTDILRDVDIALYQAKQMGGGCYMVITPEMQSQALERIQLESDIRRGIKEEQFCLYYQPIVSLQTQTLVGFEALIRWQHPQLGMVSPGVFIEVAEEMGVISEIDLLAFKIACQQLAIWAEQFTVCKLPIININCSSTRLQQPEILEQISLILNDYGIPASKIKLEVTESGFFKTINTTINTLRQIHKLGIKLCIDDFGTGYSSLSRLHNFPLDTLKIDRSFVMRLTSNTEGEAMIQTIISLAHNLNMDVVAEGIETQEQVEKLIELGCEYGQGYLFSKPLPSQQVTQCLIDRLDFTH